MRGRNGSATANEKTCSTETEFEGRHVGYAGNHEEEGINLEIEAWVFGHCATLSWLHAF